MGFYVCDKVIDDLNEDIETVVFSGYLNMVDCLNKYKVFKIFRIYLFFVSFFMLYVFLDAVSSDVYERFFTIESVSFLGAAIIAFIFATFMPRVMDFMRMMAVWQSKKVANKIVENIDKIIPFTAVYSIEDHLVTYSIETGGKQHIVWKKKVRGTARQGDFVTILFFKWPSMAPYMTILHSDKEAVRKALEEQGIECRPVIKDAAI